MVINDNKIKAVGKVSKILANIEDDLREIESDLLTLKVKVARGVISKESILRDLDKMLEAVRR